MDNKNNNNMKKYIIKEPLDVVDKLTGSINETNKSIYRCSMFESIIKDIKFQI